MLFNIKLLLFISGCVCHFLLSHFGFIVFVNNLLERQVEDAEDEEESKQETYTEKVRSSDMFAHFFKFSLSSKINLSSSKKRAVFYGTMQSNTL